jgi:hypothetical protein
VAALYDTKKLMCQSNMLGHTDSSMTLSKYTHYVKRKEKKRAQFMNNELTPFDTDNDTEFEKVA